MGSALTTKECLKQAQDFLQLAATASDPDLRNRYLKLAADMTALAAKLDLEPRVEDAGDAPAVKPQDTRPRWIK